MTTKKKRPRKKPLLIPRAADGSIPSWVSLAWGTRDGERWEEQAPFHAVVQLLEVDANYRSGARAIWKDVLTLAQYPMFLSEFNRLITEAEWAGPLLLDGLWLPVKRGSNYSISWVRPEEA